MARAKSTSGKSNRTSTNTSTSKDQPIISPTVSVPEVNTVAAEPVSSDVKPENKIKLEPRKFEVRKPEPRKNIVPINLDEEIRRRAYELYQRRESGTGSEAEDWLTAEREVMQRYHQQSA